MTLREISPSDASSIIELNQEAVAVTSPMDHAKFQHLLEISSLAIAVESNKQVVGFLIGMIDNAPYQNGNYQWFSERLKNFFYIDRIVIAPKAQGQGVGKALYSEVDRWASENDIRQLAAEMDFDPPNSTSLEFHQKMGFLPIGYRPLESGKIVSMQTKQIGFQAPVKKKYPIQIDAPDLEFGGDSWIINKWHVANGERVSLNDVICDMENDTITCEVEAFDQGVIEVLIKDGQQVTVGEAIAFLHEPSLNQKS